MTVETLGIDIAKNVFQLHGVNQSGNVVLKRRVMRDQLLDIVPQVARCTIERIAMYSGNGLYRKL